MKKCLLTCSVMLTYDLVDNILGEENWMSTDAATSLGT